MPKFFVCSDIHGFYDDFISALSETDYDKNNNGHFIVFVGDTLDRGKQPKEMIEFINNGTNIINIKGNHDILMRQMLDRKYFEWHDIHNGTLETALKLGGRPDVEVGQGAFYYGLDISDKALKNIFAVADTIITPFQKRMINYFETKNYIFCHSWIPIDADFESFGAKTYVKDTYLANWRYAHQSEWDDAMWKNPFKMAANGLNKTGKTIVSGHWHTSWPRHEYHNEPEFGEEADFSIYFDKENQHIGIDACTAYSNRVNILEIEDDFDENFINEHFNIRG